MPPGTARTVVKSVRFSWVILNRSACNGLRRKKPYSSSRWTALNLLVLAGEVIMGKQSYEHGSWMRLPAGDSLDIIAGAQGATVYLKTGHLGDVVVEA